MDLGLRTGLHIGVESYIISRMKLKLVSRKKVKRSGPIHEKVKYNNPPIGMDGKLITPFSIVITDEDEEMTIETDDPLEAEYMVTLCKYPEFLAQELKKAHAWIRKNKMKIVEDKEGGQ